MSRTLGVALVACSLTACFDDRVGLAAVDESPSGQFTYVDAFVRNTSQDLDLLFVIDNSAGMDSKQQHLADMVPNLLAQLLAPRCVSESDEPFSIGRYEECPAGSHRRGNPFASVHVGVITTSLGGLGQGTWCASTPGQERSPEQDMAHLLGSLPRGRAAAPSLNDAGFFALDEHSELETAGRELAALIMAAGTDGCPMEAPLEAWLRFLVDPEPYAEITPQPCTEDDVNERCIGPATDEQGKVVIDRAVLDQRKSFLRADSLVSIVMLSDENDCSMHPSGINAHLMYPFAVPRASGACQGSGDDECCQPCLTLPREGCPREVNANGQQVALGCAEGSQLYDSSDVTLQCFDQQRRFGWEGLYPIERYQWALQLPEICPGTYTLHPTTCEHPVPNPLASAGYLRAGVHLTSIAGVPWQDLAEEVDGDGPLTFRHDNGDGVDWRLLLPDPETGEPPRDPLMVESIEPREGIHPMTGEKLAPSRSGPLANSINGHEFEPHGRDALQYACIFPLQEPRHCPERSGAPARLADESAPSMDPDAGAIPDDVAAKGAPYCACSSAEHDGYDDPLCQAEDGSYSNVQRYSGANPGLRQLQLLKALGWQGQAASICPKSLEGIDRGYQPLRHTLLERVYDWADQDERFRVACAARLPQAEDSTASCVLVEAVPPQVVIDYGRECSAIPGRKTPTDAVRAAVRRKLAEGWWCNSPGECDGLVLCEVVQLGPGDEGYEACKTVPFTRYDGWCPLFDREGSHLLERCPSTVRAGLRFPAEPSRTGPFMLLCAGKTVR